MVNQAGRQLPDGHYSSGRFEDGATVIETHRFYHGHEITIIERLRMSEDGKTLVYSQEIEGLKQQQHYQIDFDLT